MTKISTSILIFFLCFSVLAQNEKWDVETIKVEDGLRSNAVTAILKDHLGYMWFGTKSGLHRYDGYELATYNYGVTGKDRLSDAVVYDLAEDKDGNIWIATGLNKFDRDKERILYYLQHPDDSIYLGSGGPGSRVYIDKNDTIWVGTPYQGLCRLDKVNKIFVPFVHNPTNSSSIGGNQVSCIYEDHNGTLWISSFPEGLHKMNRDDGTFQRFPVNPTDTKDISNYITCLYEDQSGNFWVATRNGMYLFDRSNGQFLRVLNESDNSNSPKNQQFTAILDDFDGNYWIRTYDGLYRHNKNLKILNALNHAEYNTNNSNVNFNILSLYQDISGIIWYTKHWEGIVKLIPRSRQFKFYQNNPKLNMSENYSVSAVCATSKDIIWMGTYKGLSRLDRKKNEYKLFQHDPEDPYSLSHNIISSIRLDHSGNLLIATRYEGINRLILTGNSSFKFIRYQNNPVDSASISKGSIYNIIEGSNGKYFILFYNGKIDIFHEDKMTFEHLEYPLPKELKNRFFHFTDILEEEGEIWATSTIGLFKMKLSSEKNETSQVSIDTILYYNSIPNNPNGLNYNKIDCIYKDHTGTIWLGTFGGGLNKMIKIRGQDTASDQLRFEHYTKFNGLCHDNVSNIMEDKKGNLWIGTQGGLAKYNPQTNLFINYDKTDGLTNLDFASGVFKGPDGEMFFSNHMGLISFYPDSVEDNPIIPPIVITDLQIFNETLPVGGKSPLQVTISNTTSIELPHNLNFLSFEYAALNYVHPEKNQYKYKMVGLDPDWIEGGTRRHADYPDLKPGNYTFRVIGSNNNGIWNLEGESLHITINPPIWATYYACTAYCILAIVLIFGLVHLRSWQIRKQKNILERQVQHRTRQIEAHQKKIESQKELLKKQNRKILDMDKAKTKFFTNVSHELRTPLTLIQGPAEELMHHAMLKKNELNKLDVIMRNAKCMLDLTNQLLDIAKLESGSMKLTLVKGDIFEFLRVITGTFTSMAEIRGIVYNRIIPNKEHTTWFDLGAMEKIVSNLLSNAFKFTPEAGRVSFKADLIYGRGGSPDLIEFSITDQGPGIPSDAMDKIFNRFYQVKSNTQLTGTGTGIGLSLVRDLLELNHGEISVQSDLVNGSIFTVKMPLGKSHLNDSEFVLSKENPTSFVSKDIELHQPTNDMAQESTQFKKKGKPIILIVEDNSDLRRYIYDNLKNDYRIVEAVNGSAGLKKALEIIPDLIISDLIMPIMDGIELSRKIKTDECTSHIPIIILTAKTSLDEKMEGLKIGADDYILKPFHMTELRTRVSNLIEQRKKLRERYGKEIRLKPRGISITSLDESFLTRAIDIVSVHISDETFDLNKFLNAMHMSHSTLFRKLHALTNQSPTEFIRNIRLKRAAKLLEGNFGNVAEVSYEVGFNNPSYFSKCFKALFGVSPLEYTKEGK